MCYEIFECVIGIGISMGNIQVRPEELRRIAKNFKYASNIESDRHLKIQGELLNLQMRWIGASSLSFIMIYLE